MHERTAAIAPLQAISGKIFIHDTLPSRFPPPRRRRNHLGLTPTVYLTHKGIRRAIAACDGCCDWPARQLAAHCGVSVSTYFAHAAVIEAQGLLLRIPRRGDGLHNDTSLWMLPVVTTKVLHTPPPAFEREKLSLLSSKALNTPLPPTADADGGGQPARPTPSEVHAALAEARMMRQERKRERRQRRYAANRERVVCRTKQPLTPVQQAARHIMGTLGVALSWTATREAIERSAADWMTKNGDSVAGAVNALVAAWKDYQATSREWNFEYTCGMVTFFGDLRYLNPWPKHHLRQMRDRRKASIGSNPPQRKVDAADLKAKMALLLAGWSDEDEMEEGGMTHL